MAAAFHDKTHSETVDRAARAIYESRGLSRSTGRAWDDAIQGDRHYCIRDAEAALSAATDREDADADEVGIEEGRGADRGVPRKQGSNLDGVWKVHMPNLLKEILEANNTTWILAQPVRLLRTIMTEIAVLAIELDDPRLNVLMLRLALYDVHPNETAAAIARQEARTGTDRATGPSRGIMFSDSEIEDIADLLSRADARPWRVEGSVYKDMEAEIVGEKGLAQFWKGENALANALLIAKVVNLLDTKVTAMDAASDDATPASTRTVTERWTLTWTAAPRPPVHPNPMTGRQDFASFDKAMAFMRRQPTDAVFVSLKRHEERSTDWTGFAHSSLAPAA